MTKKEEMLREAVHNQYACFGMYGCTEREYCRFCVGTNNAHNCDDECFADEFAEGFEKGWDACMKHLAVLPWDEAMNEIAKLIETNRSGKPNSSNDTEV